MCEAIILSGDLILAPSSGQAGVLARDEDGEWLYFSENLLELRNIDLEVLSKDPLLFDMARARKALTTVQENSIDITNVFMFFNYGESNCVIITKEECVIVDVSANTMVYVEESASLWGSDCHQYTTPLLIFDMCNNSKVHASLYNITEEAL